MTEYTTTTIAPLLQRINLEWGGGELFISRGSDTAEISLTWEGGRSVWLSRAMDRQTGSSNFVTNKQPKYWRGILMCQKGITKKKMSVKRKKK